MIFVSRSGGGCLPVLLFGVFLLLVLSDGNGGGGLFVLVLFGMFFLLPFLFLRSTMRSATRVLGGPVRQPTPQYDPQYAPQPSHQPQPVDPADVTSLLDRLGHDVRTLQVAEDDATSRQAMADASERYSTATSLLERARSQDQLRTAWLAAVEGLHATRLVRGRLGLDLGPAPALPPGSGPQLQHRARVTVDGRDHVGAPSYEPGHSHWFPGGQIGGRPVPGGWYAEPFWPGSMVLNVLSLWTLSSLMTGGLYGDGFGYGEGDATGDAGGDWGGGDGGGGGWDGGGDWGGSGGGGGWGDGGGGGGWGDFGGGGGGDFGGGDFGGGDW